MVPRLPHPTSRTYRPPPALEALLLAAPLLGLAGCDDPAEPGPPPASLAELAFVDDTIPLTDILHRWTVEVRARDETGRPIPTESLGWSVGDSSVVKLLEPGLLEAQGSGRSWVAVSWEGRSDTAVVAVDARVKSVTASPAALELLPGADVGALVLVRDAEGDPPDALGVGGDWLYADGPWQPTRLEALGCEIVRSSSRADARCMHPVVVAGQG